MLSSFCLADRRLPCTGALLLYLVSTSALSQQLACPDDSPTLLNYYQFDSIDNGVLVDSIGDTDGNASNIVLDNGVFDNAAVFNGVDSFIEFGTYSPPIENGFSIAAWVKPDSFTSVEARILSKASGVQAADHQVMLSTILGSGVRLRVRSNGVTTTLASTSGVLDLDSWNFLVATYDQQTMRIYHNATEVVSAPKSGLVESDSSVPMALGNQPPGAGDRPFHGLMDELRIYDTALTPVEINALFNYQPADCEDGISAPRSLTAQEGVTEIQLDWLPPVNPGAGIDYYEVIRDGAVVASQILDTAFLDQNLSPEFSYSYAVQAVDINGVTSQLSNIVNATTNAVPDTDPPETPANLHASDTTSESITLAWDESADIGTSGLQGYRIYKGPNNDLLATVPSTSYTDTGLQPDSSYNYTVTAIDQAIPPNESSGATLSVTTSADTIPPSQPENIALADVTDTTVTLRWDASTDTGGAGLLGYNIKRDGNFLSQQNTTEFTDSGLTAGTLYTYEITALDAALPANESGPASIQVETLSAPDLTPPNTPANLSAVALGSVAVELSWGAATDTDGSNVAAYQLLRDGAVLATQLNATSYTDLQVNSGQTYDYQVQSIDLAGNISLPSATVSVQLVPDSDGQCLLPVSGGDEPYLDINADLLNLYEFDSTVGGFYPDSVGAAHAQIGTTALSPGYIASGVHFDSPDDMVNLGEFATDYQTGFTLSMWVNADTLSEPESRFFSKATGVQGSQHIIMLGNYNYSALRFRLRTNNTTTTLISPANLLQSNVWTFVTATYDMQNMRIYHNGIEVASTSKTGAVESAATVMAAIGNQPPGAGSRPFPGHIDEVRLYNRALSGPEVEALMTYATGVCEPIEDNEAPDIPTGLQASVVLADSVTLEWNEVSDNGPAGLAGYRVYRDSAFLAETINRSYTDTTVGANQTYSYSVTAIDRAIPVNESASAAIEVTTPAPDLTPDAPGGLFAYNITASTTSILWAPALDSEGAPVTGYSILRDGVAIGQSTSAQYTDSGLTANTLYDYSVISIDSADPPNTSPPSAVLQIRTLPAADQTAPPSPAGLSAQSLDPYTILLSWNPVTDVGGGEISGYKVFRNGLDTGGIFGAPQFRDTGLNYGVSYQYTVVAIDLAGNESAPSGAISVQTENNCPAEQDPGMFAETQQIYAGAATTVAWGDIDQDGDLDIFVAEGNQHNLASIDSVLSWFEAPGWGRHDVGTTLEPFTGSSALADIDNDGDLDIVVSQDSHSGDNNNAVIYWYENVQSAFTYWPQHIVEASIPDAFHLNDMIVADIDADGLLDIAVRHISQPRIVVYFQNPDTSWTPLRIDTRLREGLQLGDLDLNGKLDIIANGYAYLAPADPRTSAWSEITIDASYYGSGGSFDNTVKAAVADFNNDGRPDVLISPAEGTLGLDLAWYEGPIDTLNGHWVKHIVEQASNRNHQAEVVDIDNDGDPDIYGGFWLGASGTYWWENTDGTGGNFQRHTIDSTAGCYSCLAADFDNDGDVDFGGPLAYQGPVLLYENLLNDTFQACELAISAPRNASASADGTTVQLNWQAPDHVGAGVAHYQVFRDDVLVAGSVATTGFSESELNESTYYVYKIRAVDSNGNISDFTSDILVTTGTVPDTQAPDTPENFSVTDISSDSVSLQWDIAQDNGPAGVLGYQVFRDSVLLQMVSDNTFTDTSVLPNSSYSYSVSTLDQAIPANESAPTAALSVQTPADTQAPNPPANLLATDIQDTSITLAWSEPTDPGGSGISGYNVSRDGELIEFTSLTELTHNGLQSDTDYLYSIVALDNASPANASTPVELSVRTAAAPDTLAPDTPQNLIATLVSQHQITLQWDEAQDNGGGSVIAYNVLRNGELLQTVTSTSFTDHSVAAETSYVYSISAIDDALPANESTPATLSVTTPEAPVSQRVTQNLQALYTFDEGTGNLVYDTSGVEPALDLTIADLSAVSWGPGTLNIINSTSLISTNTAARLNASIPIANELSLEAWLTPANLVQSGPARVISLSESIYSRNTTLGQSATNWNTRLRTTSTGLNGLYPSLSSPANSATTLESHVIYTRSSNGIARNYIDGALVTESTIPGNLSNWNTNYQLILANELQGNRPWLGMLDLVAVYDRALTASEVTQNYLAGPTGTESEHQPAAPVANPDAAIVAPFASITVDVLSNDTDINQDIDPSTVTVTTAPLLGEVLHDGAGNLTYSNTAGGTDDTFSYTVMDFMGATSNATDVTITIQSGQ